MHIVNKVCPTLHLNLLNLNLSAIFLTTTDNAFGFFSVSADFVARRDHCLEKVAWIHSGFMIHRCSYQCYRKQWSRLSHVWAMTTVNCVGKEGLTYWQSYQNRHKDGFVFGWTAHNWSMKASLGFTCEPGSSWMSEMDRFG